MSQPWADLDHARRAVSDPATSPADLGAIAHQHPELRVKVAWHNAAYPGLLEWLSKYGGPGVAAAVIARQNTDQTLHTHTLSTSSKPAEPQQSNPTRPSVLSRLSAERKPEQADRTPTAEQTVASSVTTENQPPVVPAIAKRKPIEHDTASALAGVAPEVFPQTVRLAEPAAPPAEATKLEVNKPAEKPATPPQADKQSTVTETAPPAKPVDRPATQPQTAKPSAATPPLPQEPLPLPKPVQEQAAAPK
ncbi:MAG: hypothetical protein LBG70_00670, partial [Bifidobacteriaceae bacterium]|nr:hypothetical protein [Bifidobacteriaceae bacterium]